MNAKTFTSVEIPENVVTSLNALSPDQRQQVFDFVEFLSMGGLPPTTGASQISTDYLR